MRRLLPALLLLLLPADALAKADQTGWPKFDHLVMNKNDSNRPLDARPGFDLFGGKDPEYRCDSLHGFSSSCNKRAVRKGRGYVMTDTRGHHELLGGHGNDRIHAGEWGDVIWGDYKPSGQPTSQKDKLWGGKGSDFIYASHGRNVIKAGDATDIVHAHFGRGRIDCGAGKDIVYLKKGKRSRWKLSNCEVKSVRTGQSAPKWALKRLPWWKG